MARVRIEPAGIDLELPGRESLLIEARRAGYYWPTICGGNGTCRTCFFRVRSGAQDLSPISRWEAEGLRELGLDSAAGGEVRLACQAVAAGDVVLHKPGVRLVID